MNGDFDHGLALRPPARALRVSALLLGSAFVAWVLALVLTPWQQSVRGEGRVIAYAPLERRQSLEAPIAGRVVEWAVGEGDHVDAGQLIAVISDNDPELADRLASSRDAARERLEMAEQAVAAQRVQIEALEASRLATSAAASSRIAMASDRRAAAEQARAAASSSQRAAALNLERQRSLTAQGLSSIRNLELAELAAETASAELERARASLRAAESDVKLARAERDRMRADADADIEKARAAAQATRADVAEYAGALLGREVEVARQRTMRITAPRSGTVLRLLAQQGGEYVSAGDPIAVLVPTTDSRAVELWVDGSDIPLVAPGRHVRLQFEGWPAVQFVGWPSAAVGTFGGEIAFVDATDDGTGRFRAVVVPDPNEDEPWPGSDYLRQGVQVHGWILLDRVRLGFELWRQWNGFPPTTAAPTTPSTETTKAKGKDEDPR